MSSHLPEDVYINDEPIVLTLRRGDREEVSTRLNLFLSIVRRTDTSREIFARVTDPNDAFFLYTMRLGEEEYGKFKEAQFLNVDFATFPKYVVSLVQQIAEGSVTSDPNLSPGSRSASAHTTTTMLTTKRVIMHNTTLKFVESNEFRDLEVLALALHQESDVGQKKHLAACLKETQTALERCRGKLQDVESSSAREVHRLHAAVECLTKDKEKLTHDLAVSLSTAQNDATNTISSLKQQHALEIERLHSERRDMERDLNNKLHRARDEIERLTSQLSQANGNVSTVTSKEQQMRSAVGVLEEQLALAKKELEGTRGTNLALTETRSGLERKVMEQQQAIDLLQQQVGHRAETINDRDKQISALQADRVQHTTMIDGLIHQNKELESRVSTQESALKKCHHILAAMKNASDREAERNISLKEKIASLESDVKEKTTALEKGRGDIALLEEKLRSANAERDTLQSQLTERTNKLNDVTEILAERDNTIVYQQRMMGSLGITGSASASSMRFGGGGAGTSRIIQGLNTSLPPADSLMQTFRRHETVQHAQQQQQQQQHPSVSTIAPTTPSTVSPHLSKNVVDPSVKRQSGSDSPSTTAVQLNSTSLVSARPAAAAAGGGVPTKHSSYNTVGHHQPHGSSSSPSAYFPAAPRK